MTSNKGLGGLNHGEWRHRSGSRSFTFIALAMLLSIIASPVLCNYAPEDYTMGINYGQVGNNLPSPSDAVPLVKNLGIGRVRLFNPNAETLLALSGSGLQVVIGMGNDVIPSLTDAATADQWILQHIVPYYPSTNITTILVGNELFTDTSLSATWVQLVPAMKNLQTSLQNRNLTSIKLSTAAELNTLGWSYPPSKGVFRTDIAVSVMTPLLQFLNETGSYLYINVYPYFGWRDDSSYIPMDYAGGVAEQNWGVLYSNGSKVYELAWTEQSITEAPAPSIALAPTPALPASVPAPVLASSVPAPGVAPVRGTVGPSAAGPSAGLQENSATSRAVVGGLSVAVAIFVALFNFCI